MPTLQLFPESELFFELGTCLHVSERRGEEIVGYGFVVDPETLNRLKMWLLQCQHPSIVPAKATYTKVERSRFRRLAEEALSAIHLHNWPRLGELLDLYTFTVVKKRTPEQARIYAAARIGGAAGGNFVDDGMVLVVPPEKRRRVCDLLMKEDCSNFFGWR